MCAQTDNYLYGAVSGVSKQYLYKVDSLTGTPAQINDFGADNNVVLMWPARRRMN
jgi:hypothetical protein